MPEAIGLEGGKISVGEEASAWGEIATKTATMSVNSESLNKNTAMIETAGLNSVWKNKDDVVPGRIAVAGDLGYDLRYGGTVMEWFFEYNLGNLAIVEVATFETTGSNDTIKFQEDGGITRTATVAQSTLIMGETSATASSHCKAVKDALEAASDAVGTYTVTFSNTTKKMTIAVSGSASTVKYIESSSTGGTLIGFTADSSDSSSIVADTAVVTVFDHTFTMTDSLDNSNSTEYGLSIEVDLDIRAKQAEGCKINTLSVNVDPDGFATASVSITAEDMDNGGAVTGALTVPGGDENKLVVFDDVVFTFGTIGGETVIQVTSFNFTLNNNLAIDRYKPGSATIKEQLRSARPEVTGTISLDFQDETYYDFYVAGTEKSLIGTATGAEMKTGFSYSHIYTMNNIKFTDDVANMADQGLIPEELSFRALASSASVRELTIVIRNTASSI